VAARSLRTSSCRTSIAPTWRLVGINAAVALYRCHTDIWLTEGAWNPGWRASLFPFVTRDNAELFINAPVLVADSVTGLVSAWRDALRDGLIEIRNGLHHRTPAADTGDITELIP
jgi:hypothetical protein